jgi:para-aminobenzoate synthetase component 1
MFNPSERIALAALDREASRADWLGLVESLRHEAGFWWLDSAMVDGRLGRLSFAGADPYLWLQSRGPDVEIDVRREIRRGLSIGQHRSQADPIDTARRLLPRADSVLYSTLSGGRSRHREWHEVAGLSDGLDLPFLGGAVGYFGYELAAQIEPRLHFDNRNDLDLADLSLAFVDQVLAYDHHAQRLWLLGLGFGGSGEGAHDAVGLDAREQALVRSRSLVDGLEARMDVVLRKPERKRERRSEPEPGRRRSDRRPGARAGDECDRTSSPEIESTVDASGYAKAVDTILEDIEKGNLYQANFSQRLSAPAPFDPWLLYTSLRRENPAPFGAYLTLPDDAAILSSSPERFLEVDLSRRVESRPIKGTRPRGENELEEVRLEEELATSKKDRAENLMIVDLVRNDLGRVCTPGTIEVPALMEVEAYAAVFQMVSTVTGTLAPGKDAFDLIQATFPPGSMTGAPKLASIGLLERLESVRRGVYAGALGYLDLRGRLDLSVVIRTFVWKDGVAHLHVGGGVVADSSPEGEYLESLDKARAPVAALVAAAAHCEDAEDA